MNILAELRRRFAAALVEATGERAVLPRSPRWSCRARTPSSATTRPTARCRWASSSASRRARSPRRSSRSSTWPISASRRRSPAPASSTCKLRDDWLAGQLAAGLRRRRAARRRRRRRRRGRTSSTTPRPTSPSRCTSATSARRSSATRLYRMLRFLGHRVISDNHIGDWGTQFGMIIYGWKHFGDEAAFADDPVAELTRLYQHVNELAEADAEVRDGRPRRDGQAARRRPREPRPLEALPAAAASRSSKQIYDRLGVTFDHTLGESFYDDCSPASSPTSRPRASPARARAPVRLRRGLRSPVHRPEEGRRLPLRHDRPGHDPVPHARVEARRDPVRRRSPPERPLQAALRHRPAVGLRQTSSCSTSASARSWATTAGRSRRAAATTVGLMGLLDEAVERAYAIVAESDALTEPTTSAAPSPSASASAPSSTPTSPRTARATTSSATTRCWP